MNINELMRQMRKTQSRLAAEQEQINQREYRLERQGIVVVVNGRKEIIGIQIAPALLDPEDPETLEHLLKSMINELHELIDKDCQELEARLTQGMPF